MAGKIRLWSLANNEHSQLMDAITCAVCADSTERPWRPGEGVSMEKQDGLSSMGVSARQQGPKPLHHTRGSAGSWLPWAHRSLATVLGMMKARLLAAYQGMWTTLGFVLSHKEGVPPWAK